MTKGSRTLLILGLLFCLVFGLFLRFFLAEGKKAATSKASLPSEASSVAPGGNTNVSPPENLPLTPGQVQDFEKNNLHYSAWPPPPAGPADADDESKKKSLKPSSACGRIILKPLWLLACAAKIGTVDATNSLSGDEFNPDPGAMLKPVPPPLFPPLPGEPAAYGQEALPPDLRLPRQNVNTPFKIPTHFDVPNYQSNDSDPQHDIPPFTQAFPDRWQVRAPAWERYADPTTETAYQNGSPGIWLPYEQSMLKGDLPIYDQKVFFKITVANEESVDGRNIPTPSGISAANAGTSEFFGRGDSAVSQNNTLLTLDLFQGETSFRPPDWELRIQPVVNWNYTQASENNVINANPTPGALNNDGFFNPLTPSQAQQDENTLLSGASSNTRYLTRSLASVKLQQLSFEYHLADISDNYDFVSVQAGLQPFNSDFRGFIFNDTNLGYRFFGNGDDNRYQYNVAYFDEREKDTNSQLNTFDSRDQNVFVVNLYKQDFLEFLDNPETRTGYTLEGSFLANNDEGGGTVYDRNGFIVRPEPLGGPITPHTVDAYYLGLAGDGHIGRWNLTNTFYQAFGEDDRNGLAGHAVTINAQQAALEVSYDQDWIRYKASFFFSSGDKNPTGNTATGFDSIVDNPNFIGGPFSYYVRNGFNLGGTAVDLKQDDSLIPNLRTSKTEGQSNFVNPGVMIGGLGADIDLTPKVKMVLNANAVAFEYTQPIELALQTADIHRFFGYDLSMGFFYRPLLTNNIVLSAGFGAFVPGQGYRDIFDNNRAPVSGYDGGSGENSDSSPPFLYNAVAGLTFVY